MASTTTTTTIPTITTIQGTLATKDYKTFQLLDDTYRVLHTFEGAVQAGRCLVGDTVSLSADGAICLVQRAPHPILAGYLELDSKTTYGRTNRNAPLYLFVPLQTTYPCFVVSSTERDRSHKQVAVVEFLDWPASSTFPRGALVKLLGPAGTLAAEEEALLINACPWTSLTRGLTLMDDDVGRKRLGGHTFHVDPVGCRDVDDVITFEPTGDPAITQVYITISDVASCVEELGAVDLMAAQMGCTLYRDGEAVRPMLPPFFSELYCSLLPSEPKRGVSLGFRFCQTTKRVVPDSTSWAETEVVVDKSYAYETFSGEDADRTRDIAGALDPATDPTDPHDWIATLMKHYNKAAGALLKGVGVGLLRRHTAPDQERLTKYAQWSNALSHLAYASAEYCPASDPESGHWGLGAEAYCHATSPIRRYADLANQRILKQLIRGNSQGLLVSVPYQDLNDRMKGAKRYERDLLLVRCLLGPDTKRQFEGIVLDLVEDEGVLTLRLWIADWAKTISCRYRIVEKGADGTYRVRSADETTVHDVREGAPVRIECGLNVGSTSRRWKERILVRII